MRVGLNMCYVGLYFNIVVDGKLLLFSIRGDHGIKSLKVVEKMLRKLLINIGLPNLFFFRFKTHW